MRVEWDLEGFCLPLDQFHTAFEEIARPVRMNWRMATSSTPQRVAIFVSRETHCLADLLHRHQTGELPCEIPLIVSNHQEAEGLARFYGVPYHVAPHTEESRQIALMAEHRIDLIVLARYMRVLSPEFVRAYERRIINVHHSFLPAFSGARPYHQAFARGVKLIGATSHYVTEVLDDGPIIEQDVLRVSHRRSVARLDSEGSGSGENRTFQGSPMALGAPHPGVRQQNGYLRLRSGREK